MKKLFIILCILAIPSLVFAGGITDKHKAVIARRSPCPTFYKSAGVVLSWDGNHTLGANYACDSSGNALEGDNTTAPITFGTAYGEAGGSIGALIDNINEYCEWTQTAAQYIDPDADMTLWFRVYITMTDASLDDDIVFFESHSGDAQDELVIYMSTTPSIIGDYRIADTPNAAAGVTVPTGQWVTVGYTWQGSVIPDGDHSGENDYEGGPSWDRDSDEIDASMTDPTKILIGERFMDITVAVGAGESVKIDKWVLMSGFEAATPPAGW